jgi:hypothetical protein
MRLQNTRAERTPAAAYLINILARLELQKEPISTEYAEVTNNGEIALTVQLGKIVDMTTIAILASDQGRHGCRKGCS